MRLKLLMAGIAGADTRILRTARSDLTKYSALGAVVLMTALMAAVSGGFAVSMALHASLPVAAAVGLLWGSVVFNLDRLMVTQMVRQKSRRAAVWLAVPRIFVALVLGVVISTPLILQIFAPEISTEMQRMQVEDQSSFSASQNASATYAQIPAIEQRIAANQAVLSTGGAIGAAQDTDVLAAKNIYDAAEKAYQEAQSSVICEVDGSCGTGKIGHGPAFQEKVQHANDLRDQRDTAKKRYDDTLARVETARSRTSSERLANARSQLSTDQAELTRLKRAKAAADAEYSHRAAAGEGLLARLEALDRLSRHRPYLLIAHVFLFLLFATVELMPVVMKVLQLLGPMNLYERVLEVREQEAMTAAHDRLWVRHELNRSRSLLQVRLERHRTRLALTAGQAANESIIEVQRQVLDRLVQEWAEQTIRDADADLQQWRRRAAPSSAPLPSNNQAALDYVDVTDPMPAPLMDDSTQPTPPQANGHQSPAIRLTDDFSEPSPS